MEYNIRYDLSTLGSIEYPTGVQSALVVVDDEYEGLKVYLGCANLPSEGEIYQEVARLGNKVDFNFIERLYLELKKSKEKIDEKVQA